VRSATELTTLDLLESLIRGFDRDLAGMGRTMREVSESSPEEFADAVVHLLKRPGTSRGYRYLAALLVARGLMIQVLNDTRLTTAQAIAAARLGLLVDPALDVTLARDLAAMPRTPGHVSAERLMSIIAAISDGTRILPSLVTLRHHPNSRIRSKVVLLMGRATHNCKWVETILAESDARVRANAVEALWGVDSEPARLVLKVAAEDTHHRVRGNALLGLYRLGDPSVLREILRMATHPSPAFRSAAAWLMGETGDLRFLQSLDRMATEPDLSLRSRAFRAAIRLRDQIAGAHSAGTLAIAAGVIESTAAGGSVRVSVATASQEALALLPTQFVLTAAGETVTDYSVTPIQPPRSLMVSFLLPKPDPEQPAAWLDALRTCLARKRPADAWSIDHYDDTRPDAAGISDDSPRFDTGAQAIAEQLQPGAGALPGFWAAVRNAVGTARGARHVIVYNRHNRQSPLDLDSLVTQIQGHQIAVHGVNLIPSPVIESVCRETGGDCRGVAAADQVAAAIEKAYLRLLPHYRLEWEGHMTAELRLQICCSDGYGEETIA
jgi:hypothetical protein